MNIHRSAWKTGVVLACAALTAGCEGPQRQRAEYPRGALHVRYESATTYSTCLVASVAMAGNYLLDEVAFHEPRVREELKLMNLDETLVGDIKKYLQTQGLYLVTLTGRLDNKPPTGLGYWVKTRRYPVICVINRDEEGDTGFNHAVVVIGISSNEETDSADIIHYFDPATEWAPLHSDPAPEFETLWGRCDHAMMIVVAPPEASG